MTDRKGIDPLFAPPQRTSWAEVIPEFGALSRVPFEAMGTIADALDPDCPPDGDWLLNLVHAEIQTKRPDVSVEHRNITLRAVAKALREWRR